MKVRSATSNDASLIFSFIKKKSEFDRNIGAFSGVLRVSEEKIHQTLFQVIPFSYVLFAEFSEHEVDLHYMDLGTHRLPVSQAFGLMICTWTKK